METHNVWISDDDADDPEDYFRKYHKFCLKNYPSYLGYEVVDTTDVHSRFDYVAEYRFGSEADKEDFFTHVTH